jgi:hypothetical protein
VARSSRPRMIQWRLLRLDPTYNRLGLGVEAICARSWLRSCSLW